MYDLFMALRYDREAAKAANVWTKLCRMAEHFNDDDVASGRTSTIPLGRALEQRLYLNAQTVVKVRLPKRRKAA